MTSKSFKIISAFYGVGNEVTNNIKKLLTNNTLNINVNNNFFGDPCEGEIKSLYIKFIDDKDQLQILRINENDNININIKILINAFYGNGYLEVTDILNKAVINNMININVNNQLLSDPYENRFKKLKLFYQPENEDPNYLEVNENNNLKISNIFFTLYKSEYEKNNNKLNVISAYYGIENSDQLEEVSEQVKKLVTNDTLLKIDVNNETLLVDPAPNQPKTLKITYTIADIQDTIVVKEFNRLLIDSKTPILQKNKLKPIYIYYHICCIGDRWPTLIENTISYIKNSGLYLMITEIRCCVLGDMGVLSCLQDPKIKIVKTDQNKGLYERFTLNQLWDDSQNEDFNVLYLHTKGVVGRSTRRVIDWNWINEMLYCNCYYFNEILTLLDDNYTIGTKYIEQLIGPHYQGNFWWASSSYIRVLNREIGPAYTDPEAWILKKKQTGKHLLIQVDGNIMHI